MRNSICAVIADPFYLINDCFLVIVVTQIFELFYYESLIWNNNWEEKKIQSINQTYNSNGVS